MWHTFDEEACYEARSETINHADDSISFYYVRHVGTTGPGTKLTEQEFNQLREEGPNPHGL